ncbi:MAG TPA: hypothetical protein VG248_08115 [Caulobacteraceae bacterium]|jgi:hypothetical protein|nr:hypothetical protein [Caulobacteraceae bacterium]
MDAGTDLDSHFAAAVARAEARLVLLDELAELGMTIARELALRVRHDVNPKQEPAGPFEKVSHAIRLTLALQAKIEEQILALRNQKRRAAPPPASPGVSEWEFIVRTPSPEPRRERLREEVMEAIWQEADESEEQTGLKQIRLYERLVETEAYDAFLELPFRDAVAAICKNLGVEPNWSRWSDERGFEREGEDCIFDPDRGWIDLEAEFYAAREALEARHRSGASGPPADLPTEPALQ